MTIEKLEKEIDAGGYKFPRSNNLSVLTRPVHIKGTDVTLANSLAVHPMEGGDFSAEDNSPTDTVTRRYLRFARGGAGLIWFEATAVQEDARSFDRQAMITEKNADAYKRLIDEIKKENPDVKVIVQLTHSGRYSKKGRKPAPVIAHHSLPLNDRLPLPPDYPVVSDEYLDRLPETFARCAMLAYEAGFDGVDVKCCHCYLYDELLSAYNRPGKYGGPYENRARLVLDTVSAVRAALPSAAIVASRVGMSDMMPYPWGFGVPTDGSVACDLTEPLRLIGDMRARGCTLFSLTMGTPYYNPHVNRPYGQGVPTSPEPPLRGVERMINTAAQVKIAYPELTFVGAGYSYLGEASPYVAAGAVECGMIDVVGYGRMALCYPDFARDIAEGKFDRHKSCLTCGKCSQLLGGFRPVGCPVRDSEMYLPIYQDLMRERAEAQK
ncbi:MAG TPA: flavin oxidoreductase/NADH oxidase [Bacillota bacterium]|nr:flavin oxidoreductase/NADH oxidase [Clostridiales bacterium]HPT86088.1 flavin oxidoreductase/NADH oxidase [Bacillota bacterium]